MKLSYDVFIRHEVYRALQGASAHDRERVSDFIESLAGNPFHEGDATIPDEHGRAVQVKMLGRLVLFTIPAGHMMYLHQGSLEQLSRDIGEFIQGK